MQGLADVPAAEATVGLRYDAGKPMFELLPPEGLIALAHHYEIGARKYASRNWEKGMNWTKPFACMMRHAWKWMRGEEFDDETGSHHMICVVWNALAIYTYHVRRTGTDDRPKIGDTSDLWVEPKLQAA